MDEQKRLILAVVLSMIVLLGYQMYFVEPPEPAAPAPASETQTPEAPASAVPAPAVPAVPGSATPAPAPAIPQTQQKKDARLIRVSTPLYNITISEDGAAVKGFELKKYKATNDPQSPLKELVPEQLARGTFLFDLEGQSIAGLDQAVYTASGASAETILDQGEKTIEFSWASPQGHVVKKIFTFKAASYVINCDIVIENNTAGTLNDAIVISIPGFYDEEVKARSRFAFEGPVVYLNDEFKNVKPDDIEITEKDRKKPEKVQEKLEKSSFSGHISWAGYTERYFMTAVMPKEENGSAAVGSAKLSFANDIVTTRYLHKMDRLDPGKSGVVQLRLFMGPKSQKVLRNYGNNLPEIINFGGWFNILDLIGKPLLTIMNLIYDVIPNYGVAIILLTILIKLVFWPLGTKSYKSMNQMKKVQPLMMEIREKYKDDKQRMNQEIMGLYKTYKVNPAGGCLPLLVQMPIFFALYRMLYQAIELRHAPFFGWISDLSAPDRLFEFDFSIPMMQEPYGIPVLTLLMGASFLLQQKMTPTAGDPTQAKMMMIMPVVMTVIFINFPSGLVLYMIAQNLLSMGQQYYTQKKFS